MITQLELLECRVCKVQVGAITASPNGRTWLQAPEGWYVADTYPPGDNGLQYVCSLECLEKLND